MATIYADAGGGLLRLLQTPDEESTYPDPPAGSSQTLVFDEGTNAAAIAGIRNSWDAHRLVAGVLQRDGTPVAINADSPATVAWKAVKAQAPTILAALRAGTATGPQVQRVLAVLLARLLQDAR